MRCPFGYGDPTGHEQRPAILLDGFSPKAKRDIERAQRNGDPQILLVYRWEFATLGWRDLEAPMTEAQGRGYLRRMWTDIAPTYAPDKLEVPQLKVRAGAEDKHDGGIAYPAQHRIVVDASYCRRSVLIHEAAHLITAGDLHGARFCGALADLWALGFSIDRDYSVATARRIGVDIARATRRSP